MKYLDISASVCSNCSLRYRAEIYVICVQKVWDVEATILVPL